MFNKRTFALAAAMLLGFGLLVSAGPGDPDDVFEYSNDVSAYVRDIILADPPQRYEFPPWELGEEQLVEGHTTFHTIERVGTPVDDDGVFNVTGTVDCKLVANGRYSYALGIIPIPTRIDEAGIECAGGYRVVISPGVGLSNSNPTPAIPTGNRFPITTPDGQTGEVVEYVFTVNAQQPDGSFIAQEYYQWSAPVFRPFVHNDGSIRNIWVPIPEDHLADMGIDKLTVIAERA